MAALLFCAKEPDKKLAEPNTSINTVKKAFGKEGEYFPPCGP